MCVAKLFQTDYLFPTYFLYFTVPPLLLSDSGNSGGIQWIPVDSTGLQTEIEIKLESGGKYICTNSCKYKYNI